MILFITSMGNEFPFSSSPRVMPNKQQTTEK